jgi:uncharacterized protein (DUF1697 family)
MPTYVAFLRAINLGATRKFPKDAIRTAAESMGGSEVETYLTSGNLRLTTSLRSRAKVEDALEAAFLADRGFEVPTFAFTSAEVVAIAADADELAGQLVEPFMQYVSVLKAPPPATAARALEALDVEGERAWVRGRAVHIALDRHDGYHSAELNNALVETTLGIATNRKATVIRELARRWGGRSGAAAR